jgi:hypothetical protein
VTRFNVKWGRKSATVVATKFCGSRGRSDRRQPRIPSSGMLRLVDVSEERIISIVGVTRIGERGITLAGTSNRSTLRRSENLKSYRGQSRSYYNLNPLISLSLSLVLCSWTQPNALRIVRTARSKHMDSNFQLIHSHGMLYRLCCSFLGTVNKTAVCTKVNCLGLQHTHAHTMQQAMLCSLFHYKET